MSSRRYGARACVVLAVVLGVSPLLMGLDGIGLGPADAQYRWCARVAAGVKAKAERTSGSRRVIFVGGSAVPFGVRARALEARIGAAVLPYGLNAGLGIDVIAEGAARLIEAGDLVVYTPELQHFRREGTVNRALRSDWLAMRGGLGAVEAEEEEGAVVDDALGRFPERQWLAARGRCRAVQRNMDWRVYLAVVRWMARRMGNTEMMGFPGEHGYEEKYVDADGNVTFPRPGPRPAANWGSFMMVPTDPAGYDLEGSIAVRAMERLARVCEERGAVMLVMPSFRAVPAGAGEEFRAGAMAREEEWIRLAEGMGAVRLLEPGETTVGEEGAFDSFQHLNERGAEMVEGRLGVALREVLRGERKGRRDKGTEAQREDGFGRR